MAFFLQLAKVLFESVAADAGQSDHLPDRHASMRGLLHQNLHRQLRLGGQDMMIDRTPFLIVRGD